MKGHIASIAIILLLGVAVVGFMFLVKEKAENRAREKSDKDFSSFLLEKIEKGLYKACSNQSSSYIFESPSIFSITLNKSNICINNECKSFDYCEIENFYIEVYKSTYEINFSNKNGKASMEVMLWQ